ncbi:MAG: NACHT domain-containing protein [Anaerolineae bacterium]|nr:NACHT domain-containing protein [Anaerolineae bacterium]
MPKAGQPWIAWTKPRTALLMQLYAWADQRAAALRQYQTCAALLWAELGTQPDAQTTQLYEAILAGRWQPQRARRRHPGRWRLRQKRTPHPCPEAPTPLISREEETAALEHLLLDPACRLVTILGPGGMGKTRLGLHLAHCLQGHFADGTFFISLTSVHAPEYLVSVLAATLQIRSRADADLHTELLAYLRQKRLLLVLDNFEQLVNSAPLLADWLRQAAGVKLVVTSREQLHLQEEWVFRLEGLGLPAAGGAAEDAGAVQLFLSSARRLRPGF